MPGEILVEGCLLEICRVLLLVLTYYTGAVVLTIVSLGNLRCAPICTIDENVATRRKSGGDCCFRVYKGERVLRAELVALTGMVAWIALGTLIYFAVSSNNGNVAPVKQADVPIAPPDNALPPSGRLSAREV
jgi:hypothetical protein